MKKATGKAQEFKIDEFTQKSLEIEFKPMYPDLSKCFKGQKLLCRNGLILYYDSPLSKDDFYDHNIYYDEQMTKHGTRMNNGKMLKSCESENDVIEILNKKLLKMSVGKKEKINVLSLFDGISCGMIALGRAGLEVENYYSSEIDKQAISISEANYPNIKRLGTVENWKEWDIDWSKIDLLIGGSPCQGFSSSGKGLNFDDPRSKLFFEFSNILNHIKELNPNVKFMLENVKMKEEWCNVITEYLGVNYVEINSRNFSAQNRVRYYWCNFEILPYTDKGIMLEDIVEDDYIHSAAKRTRPIANEGHRKSLCLEVNGIGKSMCLVTVNLNNLLSPLPKGRYKDVGQNNYPYRVMTTNEMEKLQTVPVGYVGNINNTKAAKVLGNGWNVDTIAHIFSSLKGEEIFNNFYNENV